MTQEQKAKAYDEAIKRGLDYIRQTPATEMVTRQDVFEAIFPEYAESEDERIRKAIIELLKEVGRDDTGTSENVKCMIAYLEKQKEQKSAEWSEEDEKKINFLSRLIEFQVKDDEYCFSEGRFVPKQEAIEMLKSLRPQYHGDVTMTEAYKIGLEVGKASSWKPSEEQMEWLESAVKLSTDKPHIHGIIISLYEQLKRL